MKIVMGKVLFLLLVILAAALLLSGCAAKGYIVTNIASVVGLDVSENPKTQVPHIRFGFVRSQYYYIPTGKAESGQGTPAGSGDADKTPELVSEIDVEMKFLNYGKIKERFAVGPTAVTTPAAKILFADKEKLVPTVAWSEELGEVQKEIYLLLQKPGNRDKAKVWTSTNFPKDPNKDDPIKFVRNPPEPQVQTLVNLRNHLKQ